MRIVENNKISFKAGGKDITLFSAQNEGSPLIVLNNFSDDGSIIFEKLSELDCPAVNLLSVGNLAWNDDMTPWAAESMRKNDEPYGGKADDHLKLLAEEIIPKALPLISGKPLFIGIAGYSLAGLFSLYSLYKTDVFSCAASMSGSLWFPGFLEYVKEHEFCRKPDRLYISLGDREAVTKNKLLRTVRENTEEAVRHYNEQGVRLTFEMNPGNHFSDVPLRCAKGIMEMVRGE